jgi:Flp pilus assembly protein TadG
MIRHPRSTRFRSRRRRRGATAIEAALTLSLLVTLVLGMLDLGLWVSRQHMLAHAARQIARQAVVHGALATKLGKWGPATITTNAVAPNPVNPNDASSVIRKIASDSLTDWNRSQVTVKVTWPDGGNDPTLEQRVRVTLTGPYHPIMTFIFGNPAYTLSAASTMQIAH